MSSSEEEQQQQQAQAAASPAGSPEMCRGFSRDGEPVRPTSDKQLTRSQVRKMVRIQRKEPRQTQLGQL